MRTIAIPMLFLGTSLFSSAQDWKKLTVYFSFNDYRLDVRSERMLDSLLNVSGFAAFRIEAHCDSVGNHAYNDKLSMQRAETVRKYLADKNISDSLINIKAMGKRFPLTGNETDESRARNRCVELYVLPVKKSKVVKQQVPVSDSILNMDKVTIGSNIRLQNINFEGGKHKLLQTSIPALQQLLKTMQQYPSLEIEIQGYICCEKPGLDGLDFDTRTNDLSVNRAKVVYDYLLERGIAASRLSYKGYGANNKLVEEFTEADRTTNRRVEIKIIRK
jgi:outer membrane protein OmpA-like peptidoglycan-associated protein